MTGQKFDIKIIQKEDRNIIIQFMRDHFMKDEPINRSINLITKEKPVNKPLEDFLVQGYDNGISMKVLHGDKLIGMSINLIINKNQKWEKVDSDNEDFLTIYNFLAYLSERSDAFRQFPKSDSAVTISIMAVDASYRGMGIAKELVLRALVAGKENGCGFMAVECSSHFTALALRKSGFECIYRLPYTDYKVDGKIVYNTEPPHTEATVYVKKIT